jgi:hypothetical protein
MSSELQGRFDRYKELVKKENLSNEELTEVKRLSIYLEEIPDYLALNISTEYHRLKLEFEQREGI